MFVDSKSLHDSLSTITSSLANLVDYFHSQGIIASPVSQVPSRSTHCTLRFHGDVLALLVSGLIACLTDLPLNINIGLIFKLDDMLSYWGTLEPLAVFFDTEQSMFHH